MKNKTSILRLAGVLSTVLLFVLSLSPTTFNIPLGIRPWIFVFNVFWLTTICSGIFN